MTDDPDALARLVHEQRLAHEADRAAAEGRVMFSLGSWEERAEHQRELDRRIAFAVAARAVADAKLDGDRMRVQLLVFAAERDRTVAELKRRASRAVPGIVRDAWLGAVDVVLAQERDDEKGGQP